MEKEKEIPTAEAIIEKLKEALFYKDSLSQIQKLMDKASSEGKFAIAANYKRDKTEIEKKINDRQLIVDCIKHLESNIK